MYLGSLKVYFSVCRLESWSSWIFSFVLGSILFTLPSVERLILIFLAFAFATAFTFVINQYFDREVDKNNKTKRTLPVASEKISPRKSLTFSALLGLSSLILVGLTDIHLLPCFIIYLGLGTAYSAPIPNFKNIPILDFMVSGVGAGFLPFYIGLGTAHQLDLNISLVILISAPLILYQFGGHIIQAVGDYTADRDVGLNTFPVRYGQKRAIFLAGVFFFLASISPFIYLFLGLIQPIHFILGVILIPLFIPILIRFIDLYKRPSEKNVINLQKTVKNIGIFGLIIILTYILLVRFL